MNKKKTQGFTLIELLICMAVMAILGVICTSLINGSNVFYKGIHEDYDGQSEARIAISYVTTKLRENDVEGGIELKIGSNNKIRIKDSSGSYTNELYFENKKLKEKRLNVSSTGPVEIGNIESFEVIRESENNNIKIVVGYLGRNNKKNTLEEVILLRCGLKKKT